MQSRFLHSNDTKTWDAFRGGNQAAFGYIYHTYFQSLYNYGRKFSRDDSLLGDTLQQLFTELWQKRKRLGPTDQIRNYLYKSFRRALLRNQAKKNKNKPQGEDFSFGVCLSHEAQLIQQQHQQEQQATLQRAVEQLTEKQREVIYLRFYDGLSYAEISEIMEISAPQVYDFMYKALGALRKKVKKGGGIPSSLTSSTLPFFLVYNIFLLLF